MKKAFLAFSALVTIHFTYAQVTVPKTPVNTAAATAIKDFIKPPAIGDIGGTTSGIVDMLTSKLALPGSQKPKLTEAISSFLTSKKGITGLADTNPAGYLSKFNPLQKGLFSKLKTTMGAAAFTKFLGLKPSGSNIAGNALSNLFF